MNKACHSCGRIITVPDIPLPDDYPQKCRACGFNNPVNDDYSPGSLVTSPLTSAPNPDEDTWDSTFDHALDDGLLGAISREPPMDSLEEKMVWKIEQKLVDMEHRLRKDSDQAPAQQETAAADPFMREVRRQVCAGEVLIGTANPGLLRNLQSLLSERGYVLTVGDTLANAYSFIKQKNFQFLVLDQTFLNGGEAGREIFKHIKKTPAAIRRCQTVVLISQGIATCESQVFYQWSIDLNVHPRDLDRLDEFLTSISRLKSTIFAPYLSGRLTGLPQV